MSAGVKLRRTDSPSITPASQMIDKLALQAVGRRRIASGSARARIRRRRSRESRSEAVRIPLRRPARGRRLTRRPPRSPSDRSRMPPTGDGSRSRNPLEGLLHHVEGDGRGRPTRVDPRRRAMTLCTPSAAITRAPRSVAHRASRLDLAVGRGSLDDLRPVTSSAPASTASDTSRSSNSSGGSSSGRHVDSMTVDSPRAPPDGASPPGAWQSASVPVSRYGNRFRTLRLIPPPHGLFLGNLDRSSSRTG